MAFSLPISTTAASAVTNSNDQSPDAPLPHVSLIERPNISIYHLTQPIQSTQDEARRLLHEQYTPREHHVAPPIRPLAVVADIQLAGRGTNGRRWERGIDAPLRDGNVYVTVALPMSSIPVTVTLLPLHVAVVVARHVSNVLATSNTAKQPPLTCDETQSDQCASDVSSSDSVPRVIVKWPNDVLIHSTKISGTLIESETVASVSWLLVGIGINVLSAPRSFAADRHRHGRAAACLQDFVPHHTLPDTTALTLSIDLAQSLADWVGDETIPNGERDRVVLDQWKQWAVLGQEYQLRHDRSEGDIVTTLDIEPDGQLRVRDANGRERLLMADYLV